MMYYHIKAMYDQWSTGQTFEQCRNRRDVFISMVSHHIGYDVNTITEFLATQAWFPKPKDSQGDKL